MNWLLYRGEKFNANFFYQSGVDIDHSFLLVSRERRVLLVPEMNKDYAESLFNGEVIPYAKKPLESISKVLKKSHLRAFWDHLLRRVPDRSQLVVARHRHDDDDHDDDGKTGKDPALNGRSENAEKLGHGLPSSEP